MKTKNFERNKKRRREAAAKRLEVSSKRTPQEQVKHLDAAGFTATKERQRLAKKVASDSKK